MKLLHYSIVDCQYFQLIHDSSLVIVLTLQEFSHIGYKQCSLIQEFNEVIKIM